MGGSGGAVVWSGRMLVDFVLMYSFDFLRQRERGSMKISRKVSVGGLG